MIQFLVALALCYVLIKIPFWIFRSIRGGGGRSVVGGLIRGLIAYKTFGLVRGFTGGSGGPSPRRQHRTSTGDGAGEQTSGSRGFSVPNPVAAMRRLHQRRWVDPEPGMLPMKLRRPKTAHEIGTQRQYLGDELDDPDRQMPWQRESPADTQGLLGPRGGINPNARRERRPRKVVHPERGMLNLNLRHNSRGVSTGATPMRRRMADEFDEPEEHSRAHPRQSGRGLLNPTGGIDPQARARNPVPEPIPPEPSMLGLTLRPKRPLPPSSPSQPAEPETPRQPRRQQALINQHGAVTQNARARQPRRRAIRPAGSTQQHQNPQTKQSEQQQRGAGSDRG